MGFLGNAFVLRCLAKMSSSDFPSGFPSWAEQGTEQFLLVVEDFPESLWECGCCYAVVSVSPNRRLGGSRVWHKKNLLLRFMHPVSSEQEHGLAAGRSSGHCWDCTQLASTAPPHTELWGLEGSGGGGLLCGLVSRALPEVDAPAFLGTCLQRGRPGALE